MSQPPEGAYVLVTTPHQQKLYIPISLAETAGELLDRVAYCEGMEREHLSLLAAQHPYAEYKYNEKLSEQIRPDDNVLLSYKTRPSSQTAFVSTTPALNASSPNAKPTTSIINLKRIKSAGPPSSSPISLSVDFNQETLVDLKRRVVLLESLPLDRIRLVCMGKELSGDNLTLSQLGVQRNATIFVVERQLAIQA